MTHDLSAWEARFVEKARELFPSTDPSHDYLHIMRVVTAAKRLASSENADLNIVVPAAYFHDFINVPKNDPRRKQASTLSADAAVAYLRDLGYPAQYLDAIHHAIRAHSFSANITPETLEAQVVQDADRLDALGAIGIARLFSVSTLLQRPYYDADDFFADNRMLDDKTFAIDHFGVKLFNIVDTMNTESAKVEAARRAAFMSAYIEQLAGEAGAA